MEKEKLTKAEYSRDPIRYLRVYINMASGILFV